jgi:hypothetical protein
MSSMIKCQFCGGENPASTRICDYCGKAFSVDGKTLVDELSELNITFDKLKAFPSPGLLDSFNNNARFSMPVLTLVSGLLFYKFQNGFFSIPLIVFLIGAIRALFSKKQNFLGEFKSNKLMFNAQLATLYGLYSKDPATNARLIQFEKEFKNLNGLYKKGKVFEFIAYGILLALFSFSYLVPTTKTDAEKAKDIVKTESSYLLAADSLLAAGNYDAANNIIKNLTSNEVVIELKSKIQLATLTAKIQLAESKLKNKDYEAAKSELAPLMWKKNAPDFDMELIEEKYYKDYIQLKSNLNDRLPESYKVKVESELDY